MKILHLTTFLDFGGIETKKANLSVWTDENDWVFVALDRDKAAAEKISKQGKRVIVMKVSYKIPSVKTIYQLFKLLKKEKPDVVHTAGAEANFFGLIAGKIAGVPRIIVEEIGIPKHKGISKNIFKWIYRHADYTIGESKMVVDYLTQNYNLSTNNTKVVSNFGVFNYDFDSIKVTKDENTFQILTVSRLEPVKNIEGLIRVLARLKQEGFAQIRLKIAGDGNSKNDLVSLVKELNIENEVEFLGRISDPYPYLLNADLYVLNSFSEGFSNSLVEAMYSGTPSLSTQVGAAPEIITDGENGFLVLVDNEDALTQKLKDIITLSSEERKAIGTKGKEHIIKNYSLEQHIEALMQLYR